MRSRSVRQVTDGDGAVVDAREWSPYGVEVGTAQAGLGYTGEWWDAAVGLQYLRARWYDAYLNHFTSPDNIIPDYGQPQTIHAYAYAINNPVNYVDPAGTCSVPTSSGSCSVPEHDPRDLTDWLYREMLDNARGADMVSLKVMNATAALLARMTCDIKTALLLHGAALGLYSQLVKDGAVYDFKDEVGLKLGPGITLCPQGRCYRDIEYSVPGNIHFAYIGLAAGFDGWEIQAGAGYAEIFDPAHDPKSEQYAGPYVLPSWDEIVGETPFDPSTINFGDDPKFSRCNPDSDPPTRSVLETWAANGRTYPLGYFDNQGEPYKAGKDRCP